MHAICELVRYNILTATTEAGSGHPTSSLSATELATELFFGGWLRYDISDPKAMNNDRFVLSKGHASPLLYALYQAAGLLSRKQMNTLRQFDSVIEGHPTPRFAPIEAATGSLGQGLSVGLGMALARQLRYTDTDGRIPHVYVMMGDSEMAEGQVWEAIQLAGHYQVKNLIGIIDVNRLGQRSATMDGWDIDAYAERISAFGWHAITLEDGNDLDSVREAYQTIENSDLNLPSMIIAKTVKGKGVSFLEDADGWHGKSLPPEKLEEALAELPAVDTDQTAEMTKPDVTVPAFPPMDASTEITIEYPMGEQIATRQAYGTGVTNLGKLDPRVVVLDAETSNSTFAEVFEKDFPDRFFEMYIAEQNMISTGVGFAATEYIPYMSSFAAFLTRTFDQIRMAQYSQANLKIIGSHAGVSIGQDGPSQMALEDLSMMRSINESIVLYPSDAYSTEVLLTQMHNHVGIGYMRLTREKTPVIYGSDDSFTIGGSYTHGDLSNAKAVVIGAGITLHEALKAQEQLANDGTDIVVIDAYSIKPLDEQTIQNAAKKTGRVIIVEDHYPYGGLGEAVIVALQGMPVSITHLAVRKTPRSGSPAELMAYEEIDATAIAAAVAQK
jgi:transketolase